MAFLGQEIIPIAAAHVGERYVLGARAPVLNPNWRGPWDCAEFATWCAYQSYKILFGAEPNDPRTGDAFTGFWWAQAQARGRRITVAEALVTPGSFLLRQPRRELIGHIAISLGDGRVVEAASARIGVVLRPNTPDRRWDIGVLLPGVDYGATVPTPPPWTPPANILMVKDPYMRGPQIVVLQRALAAHEFDPGPIDGIYGELTEAAVIAFQTERGLVVDGEVGPATAGELGIGWPIPTTPDDSRVADSSAAEPSIRPAGEAPVAPPPPPPGQTFRFAFTTEGRRIFATAQGESEAVFIGRETTYLNRFRGLFQHGSDYPLVRPYGVYNRLAEAGRAGLWAHVIWPTVVAESDGMYTRLNTYDAGFFTFGMYQLAAHTPGENLAELFRALLTLPECTAYFPDLTLVNGKLHRRRASGAPAPLENAVSSGGLDTSGLALMLNPDPTQTDKAEKEAAARLVHWTRRSPAARAKQVETAIAIAKRKMQRLDRECGLAGQPLSRCIWASDIHHQGRGKFAAIRAALRSGDPDSALVGIGASRYRTRVDTVAACIAQLANEGTIAGKIYEDLW